MCDLGWPSHKYNYKCHRHVQSFIIFRPTQVTWLTAWLSNQYEGLAIAPATNNILHLLPPFRVEQIAALLSVSSPLGQGASCCSLQFTVVTCCHNGCLPLRMGYNIAEQNRWGHWSVQHNKEHVSALELWAMHFALKHFLPYIKDKHELFC